MFTALNMVCRQMEGLTKESLLIHEMKAAPGGHGMVAVLGSVHATEATGIIYVGAASVAHMHATRAAGLRSYFSYLYIVRLYGILDGRRR